MGVVAPVARHIDIKFLRPLAGRILSLPVLSSVAYDAPVKEVPALKSFENSFLDLVKVSEPPGPFWKVELGVALSNLGGLIPGQVAAATTTGCPNSAARAGAEIANALKNDICSAGICPRKHPVCNGIDPDLDSENIASGACLEPVHTLFQWAEKTAHWYYANYAPSFGSAVRPRIEFQTRPLFKPPMDFTTDFNIGGEVTFEQPGSTPLSVITLSFYVNQVGLNCYRSLPYLLLHEFIVHAYQGAARPAAIKNRRIEAEPCDMFSEGWMDYAAFLIAQRSLRNSTLMPPLDRRQHGACCLLHEQQVHDRSDIPSRARSNGYFAALEFIGRCSRNGRLSKDEAEDRFIACSLESNLKFINNHTYDARIEDIRLGWQSMAPALSETALEIQAGLNNRLQQFLDGTADFF